MVSLSNHPKQFNRRRTENTIYVQDYLKQWSKISKIQPVLESSKVSNTSSAWASAMNTTCGTPANASIMRVKAAPAKSTRRSMGNKSTAISDSMTCSARLTTGRTPVNMTQNYSMLNMTADMSSFTAAITTKSTITSGNYMTQTRASR